MNRSYDFAIEHGTGCLEGLNRFDHVLKFLGPVFSVSAPDSNAPAIDAAEHSIAIEFQLVQPLITGWRFFYKGGELGRIKEGSFDLRAPSSFVMSARAITVSSESESNVVRLSETALRSDLKETEL